MTSQWAISSSHMLLLHNQETDFHVTGGLGMSHGGREGCEQGPVSGGNQGTGVQNVVTRGKKPGSMDKAYIVYLNRSQGLASGHWRLSLWSGGIIFIQHFVFIQGLAVINHLTLVPWETSVK